MFLKRASLLTLIALFTLGTGFVACKKKPADDGGTKTAAMDPDTEKGKELYNGKGNCTSCHGAMGKGDGPAGAALNPKPRTFSDTSAYKQGSSVEAIAATLETGVKGSPTMPARPDLSLEERTQIAKYVVHLQGQ